MSDRDLPIASAPHEGTPGDVAASSPPAPEPGATAPDEPTFLVLVVRTLAIAAARFDRDRGFDKASGLAFSSLLALVPAALLVVSLVEILDPDQQRAVVDSVLDMVFPSEAGVVKKGFDDYLAASRTALQGETSSIFVRIFSFLTLVYFAGRLLQAVDRVVGTVWGGGGFRRFLRRLSAYWAVVTVAPILLALSFTATAAATEVLGPSLGGGLAQVFPFLVTWIAAFLFFRLMPHVPVRSGAALAGAVVTGTLWEGSKLVMGWYLAQPKTFLTTLSFFPAALLWMYVSWAIGVYGLEVAYVVHHRGWRQRSGIFRPRTHGAAREALALAALVEIASAFDEGRLLDRADLAARLGIPDDAAADALDALRTAGLVAEEGGGFRPARGASGIRATDAILASRGRVEISRFGGASAAPRAAVEFLERVRREGEAEVGETSIEDLVLEARGVPATSAPAGPRAAE